MTYEWKQRANNYENNFSFQCFMRFLIYERERDEKWKGRQIKIKINLLNSQMNSLCFAFHIRIMCKPNVISPTINSMKILCFSHQIIYFHISLYKVIYEYHTNHLK